MHINIKVVLWYNSRTPIKPLLATNWKQVLIPFLFQQAGGL